MNGRHTILRPIALVTFLLGSAHAAADGQARKYAPWSEYEMSREAEVALARSAAPDKVSGRATIKVLTRSGYEIAEKGDNGFLCLVMRSWSGAPDPQTSYYAQLRAPICFDPNAAASVAPAEELRAKLGLEGKLPDEIATQVALQYVNGQLPKLPNVAFAYMWSAEQDTGPGFGAWHPHMMIYAPHYTNEMLGTNEVGGHSAPFVAGSGTPYAIVLVAVDDKLAVKVRRK